MNNTLNDYWDLSTTYSTEDINITLNNEQYKYLSYKDKIIKSLFKERNQFYLNTKNWKILLRLLGFLLIQIILLFTRYE